ncbi:MAG TPA: hypothetical protein VGJ84_12410 [Polyangiaceae bacterium]|jgi:hypothetical protein
MKMQKLLVALTLVNLVLFLFACRANLRSAVAQEIAPVLRGRALQIVDGQGRVRASIKVEPANSTFKMPDGSVGYPETVILRLIDPKGGPHVKLTSSERGAALLLGGQEPTYLLLDAQVANPYLKWINGNGGEHVFPQ